MVERTPGNAGNFYSKKLSAVDLATDLDLTFFPYHLIIENLSETATMLIRPRKAGETTDAAPVEDDGATLDLEPGDIKVFDSASLLWRYYRYMNADGDDVSFRLTAW